MSFITLNNLTLHYSLRGKENRPALVFINSLGSDWRIWDTVADEFLDTHRVLRYDKRGHGLSDAPPAPYTMRDHAIDLIALLDALKLNDVTLIGISVGGMIAQQTALLQPQRVRALVLCDTGARIGTEQSWADRITAVNMGGMESIANAVVGRWFTLAYSPTARIGWRNMLMRTSAQGYVGTCAALRDCDLSEAVGAITQPTLVLCGDADTSTTPELNRQLASYIPGARYQLISDAAHLPCIEQAEAMRRHIRDFVNVKLGERPETEDSTSAPHLAMTSVSSAPSSTYDTGMSTRRAVLGDAHVDRAEANKTEFDADFQRLITEYAWGNVWNGDKLDRRTRHLVTLALIAGLGREHEFAMHVRAMKNTGATRQDLAEVLKHVAIYAGVPAANAAFGIAKRVFEET